MNDTLSRLPPACLCHQQLTTLGFRRWPNGLSKSKMKKQKVRKLRGAAAIAITAANAAPANAAAPPAAVATLPATTDSAVFSPMPAVATPAKAKASPADLSQARGSLTTPRPTDARRVMHDATEPAVQPSTPSPFKQSGHRGSCGRGSEIPSYSPSLPRSREAAARSRSPLVPTTIGVVETVVVVSAKTKAVAASAVTAAKTTSLADFWDNDAADSVATATATKTAIVVAKKEDFVAKRNPVPRRQPLRLSAAQQLLADHIANPAPYSVPDGAAEGDDSEDRGEEASLLGKQSKKKKRGSSRSEAAREGGRSEKEGTGASTSWCARLCGCFQSSSTTGGGSGGGGARRGRRTDDVEMGTRGAVPRPPSSCDARAVKPPPMSASAHKAAASEMRRSKVDFAGLDLSMSSSDVEETN